MNRAGKIALWSLSGIVIAVGIAFAGLQTGSAKRWLVDTLNGALASPDSAVRIGTIDGLVPFDMTVSQIALEDRAGPWLTIDQAAFRWSPSALLFARFRIDTLSAKTIDVLRKPTPSQSTQASSGLSLPRLPVAVELRDLDVSRLVVSPQVAGGDNAEASIRAHGLLARSRAELAISLARTDGQPGSGTVAAKFDRPADALDLNVAIDEPTGILMDAITGRTDHRPVRLALDGGGPLSGWSGKLSLTAGPDLGADATIAIAYAAGTRVAVSGNARITPLLTENARPLVGDRVTFDVTVADDGQGGLMLAPSNLTLASVKLDAQGTESKNGALSGSVHISVPDAAQAQGLLGQPAQGSIAIDAALSGTADRPKLLLTEHGQMSIGTVAADGLSIKADVQASPGRSADDQDFDLTLDVKADNLRHLSTQANYGALALHVAGITDRQGRLVDIHELNAQGAGIDLKAKGAFQAGVATGKASLSAGDLSVVGALFNIPAAGSLRLDIDAKAGTDKVIVAQLTGTADGLRTGITAADSLLAGQVRIDASGTGAPGGKLALSSLSVASSRFKLDVLGDFDPASRAVSGRLKASLADLDALSKALSSSLAGTGQVSATLGGTLDAPTADADVSLDNVRFQATRIDHFDAKVRAPSGLEGPATLQARIQSGKLDELIEMAMAREAGAYRLNNFRLAGTGGTAAGSAIVVDPARQTIAGKLTVAIGDLSLWSDVAGQQLGGQISLDADLPPGGRPGPVKLSIDHLALGANSNAIGMTHAALTGHLSGSISRPDGSLDLAVSGVSASGGTVTDASLHVSARGDTGDFRVHAAGRLRDKIVVDVAGSAARSRGTDSVRLTTLAVAMGADKLSLSRPATLTAAPGTYRLSGLALSVNGGQIEGDAALLPRQVSANLRLTQLPLHPLASLAGRHFVAGTLSGTITLGGTEADPRAHMALVTEGLDLETDGPLPRPKLSFSAGADWRGERVSLDAKLASGSGENLSVTGSAPFAFDLANFRTRSPRNQSLSAKVAGGGRLENLVSIVPLGEDQISGGFTIDVAIDGTIAAPHPSGRVLISGGRYSNMALGTELDGIDLAVNGAGDRFVLDHLTATDGKDGKLNASGAVDLAVSPARFDLSLGFTDFLVARGDDATIAADGDLKLGGTTADMKVAGGVKVRNAQLYIPERLPASVVTLDVTEVGGSEKAEPEKSAPLAPVGLQIALDAPGQIFVRGHGVNSEWRGHVDINGTSAKPSMTGQLSVVNGTIDLLGQTFSIDRGTVDFGGGSQIDPVLDVQASATASGVTATINVTGTAKSPKIALSSVPALPQDEILARVLFGSNVGSLTPSQGLQLAAAAATLAQGGPGILDRVRSTFGLDRLDLGSGASNRNGTQGTTKGTTVTGGKYIANGVFVGVSQGLSGQSSQAKVEVEVTPNLSVNSTFGAYSGSGFGAKYSIDY